MTLGASCAGDPPAASQGQGTLNTAQPVDQRPTGTNTPTGTSTPAPAPPQRPAGPTIPAGARFTIFCGKVSTVDHVARASQLKAQLIAQTNLKDWWILQSETESTLYYGFYRAFEASEDPAEAKRAQADMQAIQGLGADGQRLFSTVLIVPIDAPDPESPPEWDLMKLGAGIPDSDPNKPYWVLEIGSFTGYEGRKRDAVAAVREARAMGVEAYYYHGPGTSSVLIGSWPRRAAKVVEIEEMNRNADEVLLVTPTALPPHLQNLRDEKGRPIRAVAPETIINDPKLLATMRQYDTFAVNGADDMMRADNGQLIPKPSVLRPIPHATGAVDGVGPAGGPDATPIAPQPTQPRGGRLRGIGG
jgi:hypothetical protein